MRLVPFGPVIDKKMVLPVQGYVVVQSDLPCLLFFSPLSAEGAFYISLGQRPRSQIGQNSGLKARPII